MEQKTPISDPLNRANKAHPPSAFLLLPTAFLPRPLLRTARILGHNHHPRHVGSPRGQSVSETNAIPRGQHSRGIMSEF